MCHPGPRPAKTVPRKPFRENRPAETVPQKPSGEYRPAKRFSRPRPLRALSLSLARSVSVSLLPSLAGFRFVNQGGVWPKIANGFLEHIIRMCDDANGNGVGYHEPGPSSDGLRRRGGGSDYSSKNSMSSSAAAAAATMAVGTEGGGRLDWRRGLEILKEAHNAGVVVHPDLMVIVLSKAPMGNSRKVNYQPACVGGGAVLSLSLPFSLSLPLSWHIAIFQPYPGLVVRLVRSTASFTKWG